MVFPLHEKLLRLLQISRFVAIFVKVLFTKFGSVASTGGTSKQSVKSFLYKIICSANLCKFSPLKVFHYMVYNYRFLLKWMNHESKGVYTWQEGRHPH